MFFLAGGGGTTTAASTSDGPMVRDRAAREQHNKSYEEVIKIYIYISYLEKRRYPTTQKRE